MNWKEWFKRLEDYGWKVKFFECDHTLDVEEVYQNFKARFIEEQQSMES